LFFSISAFPKTIIFSPSFLTLDEIKKDPHPPFSPGLAPSDRLLFGYVQINLMGYRAENLSELMVRIQVILRAIPSETFVEVFLEWMKQLQRCIDMNGESLG
jgi:hypothetical protein